MSFCDKLCISCGELGTIYVNYSRYHRVCDGHKHQLLSLVIVCKYCTSFVTVVQNIENDLNLNGPTLLHTESSKEPGSDDKNQLGLTLHQTETLNEKIFEDENKIGPTLYKTKSSNNLEFEKKNNINSTESLKKQVFENKNQICSNCNNAEAVQALKCSHKVCVSCYNIKENCLLCINQDFYDKLRLESGKCWSCDIEGPTKRINCEHTYCLECTERFSSCPDCLELPEPSLELPKTNFFRCASCNKEFKQNSNQKSENLEYCILECKGNHKICIKCFQKNNLCKVCPKTQNDKYKCTNCSLSCIPYKLGCGHAVCYNCSYKNDKCIICKHLISHGFCKNCKRKSPKIEIMKCLHNGCEKCIEFNYCFKCLFEFPDLTMPSNNRCISILCKQETRHKIKLVCGHFLCFSCLKNRISKLGYSCVDCCISSIKECRKCKKNFIWVVEGKFIKRSCCNKTYCKICYRKITFSKFHICKD